jgi:hypothetical protein
LPELNRILRDLPAASANPMRVPGMTMLEAGVPA